VSEGVNNGGGVSFLSLLAALFIGLKLGGVIDWSWWWVLAPLWGGAVLVLLILAVVFAAAWWLEVRR
jgi:hypothetical protein